MTEAELSYGIAEGYIENQVHLFVTEETIREAGRQKDCPAVRKLAWKKYVVAVAKVPFPKGRKRNVKVVNAQAVIGQLLRQRWENPEVD